LWCVLFIYLVGLNSVDQSLDQCDSRKSFLPGKLADCCLVFSRHYYVTKSFSLLPPFAHGQNYPAYVLEAMVILRMIKVTEEEKPGHISIGDVCGLGLFWGHRTGDKPG